MDYFIHLKGVQQTSVLSKYSERMLSYFKAYKLFQRGSLSSERDARITKVKVAMQDAPEMTIISKKFFRLAIQRLITNSNHCFNIHRVLTDIF